MCGRVRMALDPKLAAKLAEEQFDGMKVSVSEQTQEEFRPSFNIPPGSRMLVLEATEEKGLVGLVLKNWGFVMGENNPKSQPLSCCRSETMEKFRGKQRGVVLMQGFFEWDSSKQPYYFYPKQSFLNDKKNEGSENNQLLAIACLCDSQTFSVLTTQPDGDYMQIHNRIPVILSDPISWLRDGVSAKTISRDEKTGSLGTHQHLLNWYPVSSSVNSFKNDSANVCKKVTLSRKITSFFGKKPTLISLPLVKKEEEEEGVLSKRRKTS